MDEWPKVTTDYPLFLPYPDIEEDTVEPDLMRF